MARPLIRSRRKSSALLPESLYEGLTRFIRIVWGGAVILFSVIVALALLSYSTQDFSFNTAASEASNNTHNILGAVGAYGADFLWQFFGIGCFVLPLVTVAWGWRIASHKDVEMRLWRSFAALGAMTAISIALGALKLPLLIERVPLDGAIGKLIGGSLSSLLPHPLGMGIVALLFALIAIMGIYLSCALTIGEWHALAQLVRTLFTKSTSTIQATFSNFLGTLRHQDNIFEDDLDEEEIEEKSVEDDEEEEEKDAEKPKTIRPAKKVVKAPLIKRAAATARQSRLALTSDSDWPLPPIDLLQWPEESKHQSLVSEDALEKNAKMLEAVLDDFGVNGQILKVSPGPVVTLYELEPSPGTRAARVISLADDIARNMSAVSVRVAVVPGRNVIGIEMPNARREMVYLRELLSTDAYNDTKATLPLVLGKDIAGNPVIVDLARMPHLLIAGTTGSGKSVAINTMILSLLYRLSPQKCRFIMIDPKMLELSVYEGIPHLLSRVVTEPKKAIMALRWTVREMEERYRAMSKLGVRNIDGYNMRLREAAKKGENLMRTVQTGFDRETGKPIYEEQPLDLTELPYIVVIVDEMADLMMVAGKEIEAAIQRLAQMARAAGIHILMATQRPSVDVITGTIKANFPTRISFQVTSKIDSRTILGDQGAEQLLGQGDMLYMAGGGRITRVHGPFVRDAEVEQIVKFLKAQGEPEYLDEVTEDDGSGIGGDNGGLFGSSEGSGDELYDKAVDIVLRERKASTSFIQRHLQIGYNKAANLVERMEREGLIGPASPTGKREIYGRNPNEE